VCCSVLHFVAVCCSVLQCVAVCCSVLQRVAVCCSVLECVAVGCSVLSVLQCVAVCCSGCSVLQCFAVRCSSKDVRCARCLQPKHRIMSLMNVSCHIRTSHATCHWVIPHINESWHIYGSHLPLTHRQMIILNTLKALDTQTADNTEHT